MRNLFDPKTGAFHENIRLPDGDDDLSELSNSLATFGWITEFPALVDERDVVLVGHRRLKAAEALGITPVIKRLELGNGDQADAERLKLALASNIGARPMTKKDRIHIAEHLYGNREWTMERIAEALGVNKATVSRDLSDCCIVQQSKHTKTATNPKGSGRPKGSRKKPERHEEVIKLADIGKSTKDIAKETGLGERMDGVCSRTGEWLQNHDEADRTNAVMRILSEAVTKFEPHYEKWLASNPSQKARQAMQGVIKSCEMTLDAAVAILFD